MKKYNIINNTLGWIIFAVAAFTYLSTIEPTASYWDCPEFVAQAFKSEVGQVPIWSGAICWCWPRAMQWGQMHA
jgi:hypothetical protein